MNFTRVPADRWEQRKWTKPFSIGLPLDPEIFGGKPIIRGMRISVELVLSLLAQGEGMEGILDDYPGPGAGGHSRLLAYVHAVIANDRIEAVKVPLG